MLTQQSLQALRQAVLDCKACKLACKPAGGRFTPTPSSGPLNAKIVIVGRSPGSEEERIGAPFSGPSGALLTQFLELAGISRDQCYLTNLAMCHGHNRKPLPEEYEICQQWKKLEFTLVKPKIVILLGDECYRFFYPSRLTSTATEHGMVYEGFERKGYGSGFKVLVTVAPSFILKRRAHLPAIWGTDATVLRVLCRQLGV